MIGDETVTARGNGSVRLGARPDPIDINATETALIVVDMQNAYASAGGYLDLAGFDISRAAAVISRTAAAIAVARRSGIPVFFLQNGWDAQYLEAGGPGSPNWHKSNALKTMRKRPELDGRLLARGGWDYAIVDSLAPEPGDIVVPKPRYSGFFNTSLDSLLRSARDRLGSALARIVVFQPGRGRASSGPGHSVRQRRPFGGGRDRPGNRRTQRHPLRLDP
jgi:ureidoacrylate peracid hydrolase